MRRAGVVLAALLVVAALAVPVWWLSQGMLALGDGAGPATAPARPEGVPADAQHAEVARVVDGDTLRARVDGMEEPVRLLNIDTPELREEGGPQCGAQAASDRLAELAPPGETIWLAADAEDRDRYDRLLRGVYDHQGRLLNGLLAREGWAQPLLIEPNDRFHEQVSAQADRARHEQAGVWSQCGGWP